MTNFATPRVLEAWHWPHYAQEYFGGDVQEWQFRKTGTYAYEVWQRPHWLPPRAVARCVARNAVEAKRVFCDMAKADENRYA